MPFIPSVEFGDWEQFGEEMLKEFSEPRLHCIYVRAIQHVSMVSAMSFGDSYPQMMPGYGKVTWHRCPSQEAEEYWLIAFEIHPQTQHTMYIVLDTFDKEEDLMEYARATGMKFGLLYE